MRLPLPRVLPRRFLVALAIALLAPMSPAVRADQAPAAAADALSTVVLELREVDVTYPSEAVVEAVRQSTIAAQVQGRVMEVRVDAGDRVRQGDVLMRIDEREAAQALARSEAQVAQARAQLAEARQEVERARQLRARQFVSQAALDKAEAAHLAAQAQLEAALAGRGQATTARSFTTITAPLAGLVAQRHAELGEMAGPGRQLVTVYDPKDLRVVAAIPEQRIAQIRAQGRARVEFPDSGRWVDAGAVTVLPTADARTHVMQARVSLPARLEGVVPGMFARVHFVVGRARKLVVPAQALVRRGEVSGIYVLDTRGVPRLRQVRVGDPAGEAGLEILAGAAAGDRVVLDPVKAGIVLKQGGA